MEKISNEQVVELLTDASQKLRKLAASNKALEDEIAGMKTHQRAEKLASDIHAKGMRLDTPREELVQEFEKEAAAGRLPTIEKAVELVGPDMWKEARASHNPNNDAGGGSGSAFENFIVGG